MKKFFFKLLFFIGIGHLIARLLPTLGQHAAYHAQSSQNDFSARPIREKHAPHKHRHVTHSTK